MAPKPVAIFRSQKCTHETGTHYGCPSRALQFGTKKRALAPGPDSHKFAGPRFLSCQHAHTTRLTSGAWRPEQAPRAPRPKKRQEAPGGPKGRCQKTQKPDTPQKAPKRRQDAPKKPKRPQEGLMAFTSMLRRFPGSSGRCSCFHSK